ncbi:class I SAM-dependent methyltransferase [Flavobacterium salilacus subsp. salilacus]|nr:class I SAM-dependent methyltransferase [Flavobacterium salilacus subsp. salilacus]MBE1615134.1 methyltransferase domain-containing protein [Flavobacterium sp. SaA2.13]
MYTYRCPLCNSTGESYCIHNKREFFKCSNCSSVFLHPKHYLTSTKEKAHYNTHNNDPFDIRYQNFVSPVVNAILNSFTKKDKGLDFGSGTGSPIVKMLKDNEYNISQYDLFFHTDKTVLQQQYNYISCTEVAEHFKEPYKEFELLRNLLLPKGKLLLMTVLFDEKSDFSTWYYKDDPTHVFFYHAKTFEWIKSEFGFKSFTIDKRMIVLEL